MDVAPDSDIPVQYTGGMNPRLLDPGMTLIRAVQG
jgi:hypothetical protein